MSGAIKIGGSGGGSAIPPNARKVVQDLKEIVRNGEDEIYAMLKECNMDPNETVQRLISQDTFHEVKRKRGKKENANKDVAEVRSRPSGIGTFRGGRGIYRGAGRGNFTPRFHYSEASNGLEQAVPGKENGTYQSTRVLNAESVDPTSSLSKPQPTQMSSGTSMLKSALLVNGSPGNITNASQGRTLQVPHMTLNGASGHTLADVVKANNMISAATTSTPAVALDIQVSSSQAAPSSPEVLSTVHPCPADPSDHSSIESCVSGSLRPIQRDEHVRNQVLCASTEVASKSIQSPKHEVSDATDCHVEVSRTVCGTKVAGVGNVSYLQECVSSMDADSSVETLAMSLSGGGTSAIINDEYNSMKSIQRQQHSVGTQKSAGSGLEWKPKSPAQDAVPSKMALEKLSISEATPPVSPRNDSGMVSAAASKLQELSLNDNHGVIIPNHLQVPEFDQTCLSFGSFGGGFRSTFSTGFSSNDSSKGLIAIEKLAIIGDVQVEDSTKASLAGLTPASYNHQPIINEVRTSASNSNTIASISSTPPVSQAETVKTDSVVRSQQYSHLPAVSNYSGLGVGSQTVGVQYSYEPSESQPSDALRLQRFVPCSEQSNFYTPVLRANSDSESRYPQFISTNIANKYNAGVTLFSGQNISSQSMSSALSSTVPPTGHVSQAAAVSQMMLTMPQHHVPIHAYPAQPAGVPISPFATNSFGYQYLPPTYTFLHAPYQHSYTGNAGYSQPPVGNSYTPAAAVNTYPPAGVAAIKYPLPQYKTPTAVGNGPIAAIAAGYGNYTTAPSIFAANPAAVSGGNASGYDDVNGPQYKESNLYIPSQQAEGSAVWVQTQLSRDMTGLQTNSYYNIPGQGHHTVHTHAHPATAYANLYHPSQSVSASSPHQLLQQPQTLGGIGVASAQSGAYQQPRGQLNWGSSY